MGLAHVVESRMTKDGATLDEAIDVAIKVASAAESGKVTTERYNTKHLDKDGVRAIVAFMPDGSRVITRYEISADGLGGANRRSPSPKSPPHVSLEEIVSALKDKPSSSAGIVPQKGPAAQGGGCDAQQAKAAKNWFPTSSTTATVRGCFFIQQRLQPRDFLLQLLHRTAKPPALTSRHEIRKAKVVRLNVGRHLRGKSGGRIPREFRAVVALVVILPSDEKTRRSIHDLF